MGFPVPKNILYSFAINYLGGFTLTTSSEIYSLQRADQKISHKSIIFEDKLEPYLNKIFQKIHLFFEHCCFSLKQ